MIGDKYTLPAGILNSVISVSYLILGAGDLKSRIITFSTSVLIPHIRCALYTTSLLSCLLLIRYYRVAPILKRVFRLIDKIVYPLSKESLLFLIIPFVLLVLHCLGDLQNRYLLYFNNKFKLFLNNLVHNL